LEIDENKLIIESIEKRFQTKFEGLYPLYGVANYINLFSYGGTYKRISNKELEEFIQQYFNTTLRISLVWNGFLK
jgi:hypothetical protein